MKLNSAAILTTILSAALSASTGWAAPPLFLDDFNRADGALGASWSSTPFGADPAIVSNQMCTGVGVEGVAKVAAVQFDPASDVAVNVEGSSADGANLKFGVVLAEFSDPLPTAFASFELRQDISGGSIDIGLFGSSVCWAPLSTPTASGVVYRIEGQLAPNGDAMVTLRDLSTNSLVATTSCNIGAQNFQTAVSLQGRNSSTASTCLDNFEIYGVALAAGTCSDGIQNGTETGVDCGGTCSACPTCTDGTQNGTETGVDCGGTCSACDVTGCSPAPLGTCRVALSSVLSIGDNSDDTKDRLAWNWKGGEATTLADLDDPTATTSYRLCVYAGGASVASADITGGSLCGTASAPCWKTPMFGQGYVFKDAAGSQGGLNNVKVIAGVDGKAAAKVVGRGTGLADVTLPLAAPVVVELQNVDTGVCLSSTFSADEIVKNNGARGMFTAKSMLATLP